MTRLSAGFLLLVLTALNGMPASAETYSTDNKAAPATESAATSDDSTVSADGLSFHTEPKSSAVVISPQPASPTSPPATTSAPAGTPPGQTGPTGQTGEAQTSAENAAEANGQNVIFPSMNSNGWMQMDLQLTPPGFGNYRPGKNSYLPEPYFPVSVNMGTNAPALKNPQVKIDEFTVSTKK